MGLVANVRTSLSKILSTKPETIQTEKGITTTATLSSLLQMGFKLSAYDYQKDLATLDQMAIYNVWVAAAIRAITRNSIQPKLKIYDPRVVEKNRDVDVPEISALMSRPHPLFDYSKFMKYNVFSKDYYGNAYLYRVRDSKGKLIAIQPLPASRITQNIEKMNQGIIAFDFSNNGKLIPLSLDDLIIWSDNDFMTDYFLGTSKLRHLLFTIQNKNNADRYNKAVLENGGEVRGVLVTEKSLKTEDIEVLRKQMDMRHGGTENAGKNMILGGGLKYEKTGMTNAEMGFKELQNVTKEEVLAVFKVPPVELGLTADINYATAKQQSKLFWETTIIPALDSFADLMSKEIISKEFGLPYKFYYDYSAISTMTDDINVRMQTAMIMQTVGYDNETITEFLDLPDLKTAPVPPVTPKSDPVVEDPAKKSIIIPAHFKSAYRDTGKSLFSREHSLVEIPFRKKLEDYFFTWRNDCLDVIKGVMNVKTSQHDLNAILDGFDGTFTEKKSVIERLGMTFFSKASETIVKKMIEHYRLKFNDGIRQQIALNKHIKNITGINETIKTQFEDAMKNAYTNGLAAGLSTDGIAASMIDATKNVFKLAESRAVLIARTETTSVANDLMISQFQDNDIEKKAWATAHDERVRTIAGDHPAEFDHASLDGKPVDMTAPFSVPKRDGGFENIDYPGDMNNGSAGNVINCRCLVEPV